MKGPTDVTSQSKYAKMKGPLTELSRLIAELRRLAAEFS